MKTFVVHHKQSPHDVFIARPTEWSNPFSSKPYSQAKFKVDNKAQSLYQYSVWVLSQPELLEKIRKELKDKVLGCWCAPKKRCHGELLAAIANDLPLPDYAPHSGGKQPETKTLFD